MTDTLIPHWTDNEPFIGSSGRRGAVTNPATGESTASVCLADRADVVQRARRAGLGAND